MEQETGILDLFKGYSTDQGLNIAREALLKGALQQMGLSSRNATFLSKRIDLVTNTGKGLLSGEKDLFESMGDAALNELGDIARERVFKALSEKGPGLVKYLTGNRVDVSGILQTQSVTGEALKSPSKLYDFFERAGGEIAKNKHLDGKLAGNFNERISKLYEKIPGFLKEKTPVVQAADEAMEVTTNSNAQNTQRVNGKSTNTNPTDAVVVEEESKAKGKDVKKNQKVDADEVAKESKVKSKPKPKVDLPEAGEGGANGKTPKPKPRGNGAANLTDESLEAAQNASKMLPAESKLTKLTNFVTDNKVSKYIGTVVRSPAARTVAEVLPGIAVATEVTVGVSQNYEETSKESSFKKNATQSLVNGAVIGAGVTGTLMTAGFATGALTLGAANVWNPVGWGLLAVGAGAAIYTAYSNKSVGKGIADAIYGEVKPVIDKVEQGVTAVVKPIIEKVKEITFQPDVGTHEASKKAKYVYDDSVKGLQEKLNAQYRKEHNIKDDNFKVIDEDGKFGPRTAKLAVEQKMTKSLGLHNLENDTHFKEALKNVDDGYFKQLNSNKAFNELQANVKHQHKPNDAHPKTDSGKLIEQSKFDLKHLTEVKVDSHANLKDPFKPKIANLTPAQQKTQSEALLGLLGKGGHPKSP